MQIELRNPFIPQSANMVDVEDFCHIDIHIEGQQNSNHYLLSLWHQFDITLHPEHSDRVPWYYAPDRINGKSSNFYYFGNINTHVGNFAIGMMSKKKGDIDSIHIYSYKYSKKQIRRIFNPLVEQAAKEIDTLSTFYAIATLTTNFDGLKIANYQGRNFTTFTDEGKMKISFSVKAIDRYEALRQNMQRVDYLLSFLAVETNLCISCDDCNVSTTIHICRNGEFYRGCFPTYIDEYSIFGDVLMLSVEAIKLLDSCIFVERDIQLTQDLKFFVRGCNHVYEGINAEAIKGTPLHSIGGMIFYARPTKIEQKHSAETIAMMSYLSGIETASMPLGEQETCLSCGNKVFRIGTRIKEFVTDYMNEDMGYLFHKLYGLRSKYLHEGRMACDEDVYCARPQIDISTGTCCQDISRFSFRKNGQSFAVAIQNVREWTTYVLRCYYQKTFFGKKDFEIGLPEEATINNYIPNYILKVSESLEAKGIKVTFTGL